MDPTAHGAPSRTAGLLTLPGRRAYRRGIVIAPNQPSVQQRIIGRYAIYDEIASGGMATVHIGRLLGEAGFSRTVAIKRLHDHFSKDPDFVAMFIDEARLASRIRHPNVVSTLDVVTLGSEIFLVMDYVQGESLSRLIRSSKAQRSRVPPKVALSIMVGALHGLHAAHDAKSETGQLLGIVHRDVSPQNILVDVDGVARVIDFGVAKAAGRLQATREGTLKGKLQYMSPEQIEGGTVDRRSDVYAASVVLWELLCGRRLFQGDSEVSLLKQILETVTSGAIEPPSKYASGLPRALDGIVLKGLAARPEDRFPTARDMAVEVERALILASNREVGEWVERIAGETLKKRSERIAEIESISTITGVSSVRGVPLPPPVTPPRRAALDEAPTAISSPQIQRPVSLPQVVPPPLPSFNDTEVPAGQPAVSATGSPRQDPAQPRAKSLTLLLIAVLVGGLFAVAVLVVGYVLFRPPTVAAPAATAASTAAPPATTASAEPPPVVKVEDLSPAPDDSAQPAASALDMDVPAGSTPSTSTHTAPPATRTTAGGAPAHGKPPSTATAPATTAAKPPPAAGCDPPYTIDADGIKRYKPECLR